MRVRFAVIPLLVILLGWNHISRLIQFGGKADEDLLPGKVKVLSYNLQNFLRVNTSTTKYVTDFKNEEDIRLFLQEQDADIVCLQEMLHDRENKSKFAREMSLSLKCPNFHYVNYFKENTKILDAIATFTRFPILARGELEYEDKSIGIYTDLEIRSDTFRVYNLHLASIHFKQEDYEFWSEMANAPEQNEFTTGTSKIMEKMQLAFIRRSGQAQLLAAHMASCPYPVIICGDFNDTPSSYAYKRISDGLTDAFVESGSGMGITYAGKYFPAFRIDFILHSTSIGSAGFERHKIPFSDHYPVTAYLYPN
jgi:endonuclease/exonuclease/phosphatase family metal-dependent hydrolase